MNRTSLEPFTKTDAGVRAYVNLLREHGVETFESCEGSPGHAFLEPTVRFHGQHEEGFRALAVALEHGLPVDSIRRYWFLLGGEPHGPYWEMTFTRNSGAQSAAPNSPQRAKRGRADKNWHPGPGDGHQARAGTTGGKSARGIRAAR